MEKQALKQHVIELSEMVGPSGFESDVRAYIHRTWAPLVDDIQGDNMGTLIAVKYGNGPEPRKKILLTGHMDEIGFMVREIKNGYLRVDRVGGSDHRITLAKPMNVHARDGILRGVVAVPPPHITKSTGGTGHYAPLETQWIDLGLPSEEVAQKVRIGDLVTMEAPVLELSDDVLAGKAMDDRAAVAALTVMLHLLQGRAHAWDVYALAGVQEEVGLNGAHTASYKVAPDLGIAIDVGFAEQHGMMENDNPKITAGPQIGIGPNFHDGLREALTAKAKEMEIDLLLDPVTGRSGTEAWAVQTSHSGVPTALFSIPVRNMHSHVEAVSLNNIHRTGRLIAEFVASLSPDFMSTLQISLTESTEELSE